MVHNTHKTGMVLVCHYPKQAGNVSAISRMGKEGFGSMSDTINNTDNLSPCEMKAYVAGTNKGKIDCVNFIPRSDGVVERIEAKRNAVVFDFFEDWEDGERVLKRFVSIECKDQHMKDELVKISHELLDRINRNG
jgi:hypothetical protein